MTDKEKILQFLMFKGVNKNQFSLKTGLSPRFFDSGNSLGVDKLRVIANNYTDLSIEWVVMNVGEMIKDATQNHEPTTDIHDDLKMGDLSRYKEKIRLLKQITVHLEQEVKNLNRIIELQEKLINN